MRLTRIDFHGLTRFSERQQINLDELGPGLIAAVGANGQGKTTLLESAPLSLFKRFPTRPGSLYDHCHGKGHVETTWDDDGRTIVVRVTFDADRRATEGHVMIDGEPYNDGKSRSFDETIAGLFGSSSLFLASVFAAQDKSGDFLEMKRGDRKALFAELLLLGHLEALAGQARTAATGRETRLAARREVLAEIERETENIAELESKLEHADFNRELAAGLVDQARIEETAAQAQVERARSAAERSADVRRAYDAARATFSAADARLRDAKAEPKRVQRQADDLLEELRRRDFKAEAQRLDSQAEADLTKIDLRRQSLQRQIADVGDTDTNEVELAAACERLQDLEVEALRWHDLAQQRDIAEATIGRLEDAARLRSDVPCDDALGARCPLLDQANEAYAALPDANVELVFIEDKLADDDPEARERKHDEAQQRVDAIKAKAARAALAAGWHAQAEDVVAEYAGRQERHKRDREALQHEATQVRRRIDQITAALPDAIRDAEAAVEQAEHAVNDAAQAASDAKAALDALGEVPSVAEAEQTYRRCQATREQRETELADADRVRTRLVTLLDTLRERVKQADTIRDEIATIERDLTDWTLLSTALGPNGVQALEIDSAGPEVAQLTNSLLEACYGTRFSIRFDTLRQKKTGGMSEVFDVTVFDGAHPRRVEALSGGERVIVGEAVSLALAVYNSRKNSVRYRTLFRDETAGALDPENADRYVQMLRRARELGGFHQVLFVAHLPAVCEAADVHVVVKEGCIDVAAVAA